jgi:hypothetical protein
VSRRRGVLNRISTAQVIVAASLLGSSLPASAHEWREYTRAFPAGMSYTACSGYLAVMINMIQADIKGSRYKRKPGSVVQGVISMRLQDIGTDGTSLYLFCSERNVFTGVVHAPDDDDAELASFLRDSIGKAFQSAKQ